MENKMLQVHHLNNSRSQRILWLLEDVKVQEPKWYQGRVEVRPRDEESATFIVRNSAFLSDVLKIPKLFSHLRLQPILSDDCLSYLEVLPQLTRDSSNCT